MCKRFRAFFAICISAAVGSLSVLIVAVASSTGSSALPRLTSKTVDMPCHVLVHRELLLPGRNITMSGMV